MSANSSSTDNNNNNNNKSTSIKSSTGFGLAHWVLVALVLFACIASQLAECQEQLTVESRQPKDSPSSDNDLADTMKYLEKLEKLDQYWSEVARPRFGRSEYKQPSLNNRNEQQQQQQQRQLPRQFDRFTYMPRLGNGGGNALIELINARLAQKYNSNEAY